MKILITGGAGFIASHIADAYLEGGHQVTIVDNLSSGRMMNIPPRAEFIEMDIRSDGMRNILSAGRFDVVNHHAAQMDVRRSVSDPIFDASVNIVGTLNLLEGCRESGVRKFIFASTGGAVYGEQSAFPATEEHPCHPLSPYGISKYSIEQYLYYYREIHQIQHVILRYANVYGPRQNPHGEAGVIAIFGQRLIRGEEPVINGDGKQTRDYVYVGDIVRANVLALGFDRSDIFNIGTGIETTVLELFDHLSSITGSRAGRNHAEAKKGEQMRSVLSSAKIERALGWKPQVFLEQGLTSTVEFFRSTERK